LTIPSKLEKQNHETGLKSFWSQQQILQLKVPPNNKTLEEIQFVKTAMKKLNFFFHFLLNQRFQNNII